MKGKGAKAPRNGNEQHLAVPTSTTVWLSWLGQRVCWVETCRWSSGEALLQRNDRQVNSSYQTLLYILKMSCLAYFSRCLYVIKRHAVHLFGVSVFGWSNQVVNGNLILAYQNAINLCASGALDFSPVTVLQTTTKSEDIPVTCP